MSDVGGRYRRIFSTNWLESPVQDLDDGERVVWLYMKTGPQSTSVGIYRLSTAAAAEELKNVDGKEFERRRDAVCKAFGWKFDPDVYVLWIPTWLDENPPQSPNVVISWCKLLSNVPKCAVKAEGIEAIHRYLKDKPEAFRKAFGSYRQSLQKSKAKPGSNQEAGNRDQRSVSREQAGTAGYGVSPSIQLKIQTVVQEVLNFCSENDSLEILWNTFWQLWNREHPGTNPDRGDVKEALREAQRGRRRALA